MSYANDTLELLPDETWKETPWDLETERAHTPVTPDVSPGRVAGFFNSLVASMALLRRASTRTHQPRANLSATEVLAQDYPHLYLRVMCG